MRGTVERFPPGLFLRDTDLRRPTSASRDLRAGHPRRKRRRRARRCLHGCWIACTTRWRATPTRRRPTARRPEAFARKRGIAQDLSHIFIGAARSLGIPARYVAGYLLRRRRRLEQQAGHAWAEAYVPRLGWVGFDPANGVCPTDAYVRVAVGLDALGAAPVRGTRYGERRRERSRCAIKVDQ